VKLCTVCGVVTSRAGSRCTEHARQSNHSRHNELYSTRAWQRLSARVIRAWRGEHGDWCPGYQRPAHPASDLTVDHVVPLAAGGAPFDIGNTAVLCRSCNSTKGATTDRGGVAHTGGRLRADRWLLDWKTGKSVAWPDGRVYADHRLQLAAYANAGFIARIGDPERHPLPAVTRFGIVHVTDGGTRLYEADVTERDWIAFRACLNLWDWQKNGGKAA